MKIIDAFPFFNEIEVLKIRLELLYDCVDEFVICESNYTFSGVEKEFNFIKHIDEFDKWIDKIVYMKYEPDLNNLDFTVKAKTFDPSSAPWIVEFGQRDFISTYLTTLDDKDVVFVSDVDEFINPDLIEYIREQNLNVDIVHLNMLFYYYYFNCIGVGTGNSNWDSVFAAKVSFLKKNPNLSTLRVNKSTHTMNNGGWHFSYLGGVEQIINKIESFSHQELNTSEIKNFEHILKCLEDGVDYLGRSDHKWSFVSLQEHPSNLVKIINKYPHHIKNY
jgi:beta-1,4-mannosyl-glycoprotein beta-1,4-N-acetylglucosaminyltransferase